MDTVVRMTRVRATVKNTFTEPPSTPKLTAPYALQIPAHLVGEGIPSPNSQFWCGESFPLWSGYETWGAGVEKPEVFDPNK